MPQQYLYARLKGFRCDIAALQRFYESRVKTLDATSWRGHDQSYVGWAVQSRDGSLADSVQRLTPVNPDKADFKGEPLANKPTSLFSGLAAEILSEWADLGLRYHRARFMRMYQMEPKLGWHRDAAEESWRVHLPVYTSAGSLMEWDLAGQVTAMNFPADGHAYLVRVDVSHRAVTDVSRAGGIGRVHLMASLVSPPDASLLLYGERLRPKLKG